MAKAENKANFEINMPIDKNSSAVLWTLIQDNKDIHT